MKKLFICLAILCIAGSIHAQILWKVTGNGLEKPSYILGTHHVAPISILDSIAGFEKAFDECTQVIGEVVTADMMSAATMEAMKKQMFMAGDTTLKDLLTADEFSLVNKFTQTNLMIDLEMAGKLKPAFITNNIAMIMAMKTMPNFNPQMQLDSYLQQKGTEQNKKTDGFETIAFQLEMLFNSQTLERQAELLVCSLMDLDSLMINTQRLTNCYMNRDFNGLHELMNERNNDHCDPLPGEMETIVDDRNIRWVEQFPEKVKNGPAFIVVGVGHLPGNKGMINLLKEKGYRVQPVE